MKEKIYFGGFIGFGDISYNLFNEFSTGTIYKLFRQLKKIEKNQDKT